MIAKLVEWIISGTAKDREIKDLIIAYVTNALIQIAEIIVILEEILEVCQIKEHQPIEKYQQLNEVEESTIINPGPVIENSSSSEKESSDENPGLMSRLGRRLRRPNMYGDWVMN